MTIPTIHRRGTPRVQLDDELGAAWTAVVDAIEAVNRAAPRGRDYHPQGAAAFTAAVAEHHSRIERLAAIRDELAALQDAIHEARYDQCPECARSYGPHYRGPCEH